MLEIGVHPFCAVDQELHEGCCLLQQSVAHPAAVGAVQLRLEVLVKALIRITLRRVGWQVEHCDLVRMRLPPRADCLGMMTPEVAEHQKHCLTSAVMREPSHETGDRLGSRCAFEKIEPHQAPVTDGRNHRQVKVLTRGCQHRRVSRRGITSRPMPILRHCRLVRPVDDVVLLPGLLRDEGIGFLHPSLHVLGLLPQRTVGGTPQGVTSALEVLARPADWRSHARP